MAITLNAFPGTRRRGLLTTMFVLTGLLLSTAQVHADPPGNATPRLLAAGLQGSTGSTIGPDGALYVAEAALGQVTRIDPKTGNKSVLAADLPVSILFPIIGTGGVMDVAFIGDTAYVLVSLVGLFSADPDGIYRLNADGSVDVIADLGDFSAANLDVLDELGIFWELPSGLQFAMKPAGNGFLVNDGHHNRTLHVTLDGDVSVLRQFGNIVPTGIDGEFGTAYLAQLGPLPNLPDQGKVLAVDLLDPDDVRTVASGVAMIIDVARGPDGRLYALSQGEPTGIVNPVEPAVPDTGRLLRIDGASFTVIADGLDRPTSLNFAGDDAVIVTLPGEVRVFQQVARRN